MQRLKGKGSNPGNNKTNNRSSFAIVRHRFGCLRNILFPGTVRTNDHYIFIFIAKNDSGRPNPLIIK